MTAAASLALVAGGSCTMTTVLGQKLPPDEQPPPPDDAICHDGNPFILLEDGGDPICVGRLAAQVFRFALCVCDGIALDDDLTTDSHDSRESPYDPDAIARQGGGAVGVNGGVEVLGEVDAEGTLIVAGGSEIATGDDLTAHGHLKTNGALDVGDDLLVRGDAWIEGAVEVVDNLTVSGNYFYGAGGQPPESADVGGAVQASDIDVPEPCACGARQEIDVASAVALASTRSSNDEIDLGLGDLVVESGSRRVELPCGVFFVDEISGAGELTIAVTGRAALFVEGDALLWDGFLVELGPEATLDVFVGGDLRIGGAAILGKPDRPSAVRLYVAGDEVDLSQATTVAASIYAPSAPALPEIDDFSIFGSLFALSLSSEEDVNIHYDRSILDAGAECPGRVGPCARCGDCGSLACIDGECVSCTDDSDCCEPLVCSAGRCIPLMY